MSATIVRLWRSLLFWPSLMLIAPQAIWVRRAAPRFAPAPGPRSGSVAPAQRVAPTQLKQAIHLLAIGDSIIDGVGTRSISTALVGQTASALARLAGTVVHWGAVGKSGIRTKEISTSLVSRLPTNTADVILISAGVNDVTALCKISDWTLAFEQLLTDLRQHSPDALIVMSGIPPMDTFPLLPQPLRLLLGLRSRMFEAAAIEVIDATKLALYVDVLIDPRQTSFAADGYHPSESSCELLGNHIAKQVLRESPALLAQNNLVSQGKAAEHCNA